MHDQTRPTGGQWHIWELSLVGDNDNKVGGNDKGSGKGGDHRSDLVFFFFPPSYNSSSHTMSVFKGHLYI